MVTDFSWVVFSELYPGNVQRCSLRYQRHAKCSASRVFQSRYRGIELSSFG